MDAIGLRLRGEGIFFLLGKLEASSLLIDEKIEHIEEHIRLKLVMSQ